MRMWGVDPRCLCRKHLLGEHVELHMFVGTMLAGRSVRGYLNGLLAVHLLSDRHRALALEMERRGFHHRSALAFPKTKVGWIDVEANAQELRSRCPDCRKRFASRQGVLS